MNLKNNIASRLVNLLLVIGLFGIVWSPFLYYKPFYSLDKELNDFFQISETGYFNLSFTLPIFDNYLDDISELAKNILLLSHLFAVILFYWCFDRNSKKPLGTYFFILCPLTFYNLTILDLRQPISSVVAVIYIFCQLKDSFKFKNILLCLLMLLGLFIDRSFVLIVLADLFFSTKKRESFLRCLVALIAFVILNYYESMSTSSLHRFAAYHFDRSNFSLGFYIKSFLSKTTDFFLGKAAFGISIFENEILFKYLFGKILLGIVVGVGFLKLKMHNLKLAFSYIIFFLILLIAYLYLNNSSYAVIRDGLYLNNMSFKASVLFSTFLIWAIYITQNTEHYPKRVQLLVFSF
jgi:hypothetical protein